MLILSCNEYERDFSCDTDEEILSSIRLNVSEHSVGMRLDRFIHAAFPQESRSRVQQWIDDGCILRNGDVCVQSSCRLKLFDCIDVTLPMPEDSYVSPQDIALDIVYEDDDILVINKPSGLVVHPAPGHKDGTLVNALLFHCHDSLSGIGGVKRPGIVHRLDKDTSGLMVVAKNDMAHRGLATQFHPDGESGEKILKRYYCALVYGRPAQKSFTLENAIGRHPQHRQKMAVLKHGGKQAVTHIKVVHTWDVIGMNCPISQFDCALGTGRTHQIRVHCQSIQCPILGDPVYGRTTSFRAHGAPDAVLAMTRQALHAYRLSFIHPRTHAVCDFTCNLPDDMACIMRVLSERSV